MARILDGPIGVSTVQCALEDFADLKWRLRNIQQHIILLSRQLPGVCKLCTTLCKDTVVHTSTGCSGCPRLFGHCFKCFGMHSSKDCNGQFFKAAGRVCWACWMPLGEYFGCSFHNRDIGPKCNNAAADFLKPLALLFYYNRDIATMACPATSLTQYQQWLFADNSQHSSSGGGQVPNILLLLGAVCAKK